MFAPRLVLRVLAGLTVAALAVTLLVAGVRRELGRRAAERLDAIAREYAGSAEGTPFRGPDCSVEIFLRCVRSPEQPEAEARRGQARLGLVAGRTPALECSTVGGQRLTSCLVRLDERGHAVLVSIDPEVARRGGRIVTTGSRVLIYVA